MGTISLRVPRTDVLREGGAAQIRDLAMAIRNLFPEFLLQPLDTDSQDEALNGFMVGNSKR